MITGFLMSDMLKVYGRYIEGIFGSDWFLISS